MEDLNLIKIGQRWYDTECQDLLTVSQVSDSGWVAFTYYDGTPVSMTQVEFVKACVPVGAL